MVTDEPAPLTISTPLVGVSLAGPVNGKGAESAHKVAQARQRCAKNADGEHPNVFLNMCENADWLV